MRGERPQGTVWLDGRLLPREQARVSIDDLGFLYGAACFETMRAQGGSVFRLRRHLARLAGGLRALGAEPPEPQALERAVAATLEANGLRDARVRLTVSVGVGNGRPDLAAATVPTVLVVAEAPAATPGPASLLLAAQRLDEARPLARVKHANFLPYLLARAEAQAAGRDDALLLNRHGRVAEAATANVFAVIDGRLVTPSLEEGPLPGVTREAVLECAAVLGMHAEQRPLPLDGPDGLLAADELFVTSSGIGVRAVARLDERAFPVGGPGTAALAAAYAELVSEECGS